MAPSLWIPAHGTISLSQCPISPSSSTCSTDDEDEDDEEMNSRVAPDWPIYREMFRMRGFRLDTVRDAKQFYERCPHRLCDSIMQRLLAVNDDDALCPDAGLRNNLFRGSRLCDARRVVIKAVHIKSRELDIIRFLSSSPHRDHPMNHCIPVLDLIPVVEHNLAFIVMEEWSSQLISEERPCSVRLFLAAIRQCIEHVVFMHRHRIAHLDISVRNILTNFCGKYAYIDFELSRRFDPFPFPRIICYRGTEVPPECERGTPIDPYKIDIWALAVLIVQARHLTGYIVPGLSELIAPMLAENPEERPHVQSVLTAFDTLTSRFSSCSDSEESTGC